MPRQIITPSNKEEWLELRSQDITSTEIGALFGLSPYVTEYELWHRKKNQQVVTIEENERMKWGNMLQDVIAAGIAEEQGWTVRRMDEYIRGSDLRIGSSFDFSIEGQVKDIGKNGKETTLNFEPGLLEIKNVDGLQFKKGWIKNDDTGELEAPLHIELQVQHQLLVSGREYAYIGALVGGNNLVLLKRKRNQSVLQSIKEKAKKFWDSIEANTPPDPNFQTDAAFVSSLYGFSEPGKFMDLAGNAEVKAMAERYKELGDAASAGDKERKAIKAQLLTIIGDSEKAAGELFKISAKTLEPKYIEAYTKKGYRDFRINWSKKK